jgi:hypothetical protein
MLIDWLRNDAVISKYICASCSENDIELIIDPTIDPKNLLIIKVDEFYNKEVLKPECSPDCLVIQKCTNHYDIYIVELRNVGSPCGIKVSEIEEKFITCLDDFMSTRFGNYFHDYNIEINYLKLFFITDPYHFKKYPHKQLNMKGHKLDFLNSICIPRFFNKHLYIEPHLPNPTVLLCA